MNSNEKSERFTETHNWPEFFKNGIAEKFWPSIGENDFFWASTTFSQTSVRMRRFKNHRVRIFEKSHWKCLLRLYSYSMQKIICKNIFLTKSYNFLKTRWFESISVLLGFHRRRRENSHITCFKKVTSLCSDKVFPNGFLHLTAVLP